MCTDFTDLNKCCPKDDFPLTRIDKIVDSATGYEMMALLDCFSDYHHWLWYQVAAGAHMQFPPPQTPISGGLRSAVI
jgi:hypothetical protein